MANTPGRLFPLAILFSGVSIIVIVALPIITSHLRYSVTSHPKLIDPTQTSASGGIAPDYTRAANWFPTAPSSLPASGSVNFFTLSVPLLKMSDLPVRVNGPDLAENAIHFSGTPLPGSPGNVVIIGHSSLPQFYNPQNPLTVFNFLPEITPGTDIIIKYDGIVYRYLVKKIQITTPDDLSVLLQDSGRHDLTLITCVPLGTYWRRFIARAELVN